MLPTAIVVFREMLEIVLILGILFVAVNGLKNRGIYIATGLALGIVGSCMVALFAEGISNLADGLGQEYFNAIIMFSAVLLISSTVIWMKRHGREITRKSKELASGIKAGDKSPVLLSLVIALTILREGSEIVLFVYSSIIAGSASISALFTGAILGAVAGAATGTLFYFGLMKISQRKLFTVTGWMLVLLCAGLSAQGAKYLIAADLLPTLTPELWDTSWLLSDDSILGKILSALVGYTARPSGMEMLFFFSTLFVTSLMMINNNTRKPSPVLAHQG